MTERTGLALGAFARPLAAFETHHSTHGARSTHRRRWGGFGRGIHGARGWQSRGALARGWEAFASDRGRTAGVGNPERLSKSLQHRGTITTA